MLSGQTPLTNSLQLCYIACWAEIGLVSIFCCIITILIHSNRLFLLNISLHLRPLEVRIVGDNLGAVDIPHSKLTNNTRLANHQRGTVGIYLHFLTLI